MQSLVIKVGKDHTLSRIVHDLVDFGYERVQADSQAGQFSLVGGTLKIAPVNLPEVFMIDFFGDEIEQIKAGKNQQEVVILPNNLKLMDNTLIHPGDYIVHEDHGVGQFERIGIKKVDGEDIEYIYIRYLNDDRLYVPFSQLEKLSGYIGAGHKKPKLSRLGSVSWKKTYKKVYEDIIKVARELLQIYAKREISTKKPLDFYPDWDKAMASTFLFKETPDQEKGIRDVYSDLAQAKPMDRLICGDVGFGKTEIAIRAAAQAIANGRQVAFLVPTTVLAEQHYATFCQRFQNLPVKVARLNRLVGTENQKDTLRELAEGRIDLVVSTHKIIKSDIPFKNLGLLVIDEEQKFGVKDKEKLKKLKESIDVLTLTATPIPRTLFMSLSGIRDISQINSIPEGRLAIDTKVTPYDDDLIVDYVNREAERGGQIYYLHNEVATITGKVQKLKRLFPKLEISVAHGQLAERELSNAMRQFTDRKIDLLVCSTIIENGLDLPNANTLIVEESDRFGLSQLYQIRGRIGRSRKQSYALFTYNNKQLTVNAVKRLKALLEHTELGTGYNIALSDLEIRGGGNILGKQQHGNMEAIGLVLYSKLLKKATERLRSH